MTNHTTNLHYPGIGFHLQHDLAFNPDQFLSEWLPSLQRLPFKWYIFDLPIDKGIPDQLLKVLDPYHMQPIPHVIPSLEGDPRLGDWKAIFSDLAVAGVRHVLLFDRPNSKKSWPETGWAQTQLVGRFLDRFLPIASLAVQSGLNPIFPPLEPGGDYWDTSFLKSSLEGMLRKGKREVIERMSLAAVARMSNRGMRWGKGGAERWPGAKPYLTTSSEQDQRGLFIFEWYHQICQDVLQKDIPILLVETGQLESPDIDSQQFTEFLTILSGSMEEPEVERGGQSSGAVKTLEGMIFELVEDEANSTLSSCIFDRDHNLTKIGDALVHWLPRDLPGNPKEYPHAIPPNHPIQHYVLLPHYEWGVSEWHLEVIRPFIKKHQPTIGFTLEEARLAAQVTVIGGPQSFPEEDLESLRASGSQVVRISGDGTSIASQLAER